MSQMNYEPCVYLPIQVTMVTITILNCVFFCLPLIIYKRSAYRWEEIDLLKNVLVILPRRVKWRGPAVEEVCNIIRKLRKKYIYNDEAASK